MSRFLRVFLYVVVTAILAGAAFFAFYEWPAEVREVERPVPAERLRP